MPKMLHSTTETIGCIDGFSILSKNCIWQWNDQMHWRIFDFCQRTAFDAETIRCIDEFSILFRCLDYRCNGEILTDDAGRPTGRQTKRTANKQTDDKASKMKRCLLTVKTGKLIREKMVKSNDSIVKLLKNVLNRLQQTVGREVFRERAKNLKKKKKKKKKKIKKF